jgi:hypothetical protein
MACVSEGCKMDLHGQILGGHGLAASVKGHIGPIGAPQQAELRKMIGDAGH